MTAKEEYRYRKLNEYQRRGVQVDRHSSIRFNSGSETSQHVVAKSLVSYWMEQAGWIVNGEVEIENRGDVDVLCWGRQGYMSYAVEIETSPQAGVESRYLEQYVEGTPIDELIVVNCSAMPNQLDEALAWIADQLPVQV